MSSSVAQVVGVNAQVLRMEARATLEDVAKAMRAYGLPWTTGRVGDLEAGRVAPSLPTLVAVAAALGDVVGLPVSLADLFADRGTPTFNGPVELNDNLVIELATLRGAVSDDPVRLPKLRAGPVGIAWPGEEVVDVKRPLFLAVVKAWSESDGKMCRNIGVAEEVGAAAMAKLWRRPFSAERDRRAGPDANAQRKGQISRQLKAELKEEINSGR